jgi:hypothetical protein
MDFLESVDGLAAGRAGYQGRGVRHCAFCVYQQASQPGEDFLLGGAKSLAFGSSAWSPRASKPPPDLSDAAVNLSVQELNWLLDGFDLRRNRPHQVFEAAATAWFPCPTTLPITRSFPSQ